MLSCAGGNYAGVAKKATLIGVPGAFTETTELFDILNAFKAVRKDVQDNARGKKAVAVMAFGKSSFED